MNKDKVMSMVRRKSEESGVSINTLLLLFFFEKFLERIAKSKYKTELILKGGFLLSSMMGIETRTTMDMDMAFKDRVLNEETVKSVFEDIVSMPSEEELFFELVSIEEIKVEDKYPGYRVNLIGRLQNIRQPFSVDVATGDPITPKAIEYKYKSIFEPDEEIKVLSYNLETILAEKIETVVSRKTNNSRSKDFYDIYVIFTLKSNYIDVTRLKEAIDATFSYRVTEFSIKGIISDLEDIREDAGFRKRWDTYCVKNEYVDKIDFDVRIDVLEKNIKEIFE